MPAMLTELTDLPAPAKLNLFLHVTGRRSDGYHLLETVFQLIDLSDRIDLRLLPDGRIEREGGPPGVSPDDDLTVRAARALAQASGCREGVHIRLSKQIPMGGGLGGGSSDAATVLLGLNRLWRLHWSRTRLAALGLGLGADVPVFVRGDNAYATGIGEKLRRLALPASVYVVVAPAVQVPTVGIFGAPELTRDTRPLKIDSLSQMRSGLPGRNDLQPVVLSRYPEVAQALEALRQAARSFKVDGAEGPDAGQARMTGSGACVFLPVPDIDQAEGIVNRLSAQQSSAGLKAWVVRSLDRHPLRDWAFRRT